MAGINTSVKNVDEISPNTTTTAKGRWTSDPMPLEKRSGKRPNTVVNAVMSTGRIRKEQAKTIALLVSCPSSRN